MKIINKFILSLFLLTSLAYADFNGRWSGEGIAQTAKSESPCENIFFRLSLSEKKFKIQDGGYNCSGLSAEYPYSVFTIRGSELLYQGEVSGFIDEKRIEIFSKEDGFQLIFILIDKKTIEVSERWQDGEDFLLIRSKLFILE